MQNSLISITRANYARMEPLNDSPSDLRDQAELYKVKEVKKKFKWVYAKLKFKIAISLPLVREEKGELYTLVARQLIWTFF